MSEETFTKLTKVVADLVLTGKIEQARCKIVNLVLSERAEERKVSASEAVYEFAGWLTTRKETSGPFSASIEAGPAADLVAAYCKEKGLTPPREDWGKLMSLADKAEGGP